jgi:hydroxyacylglutathione hydrolase
MKAVDLSDRIKTGQPPCILDVRSIFEFRRGHIPGAVHAYFLTVFLRREILPDDRQAPIVITCEHGPRAYVAKALLSLAGYRNLDLLTGHMAGWRRGGLPLEKGR